MKKYRTKIALIAALALILTAAVPALAATTTKITVRFEESPIQVLVPTAGEAVINPFKLPIKALADDNRTKVELDTQNQIATRPLVGVNLSKYTLSIGAKATGEVTGDFKFTDTDIDQTTETKKLGKLYFQVAKPTEITTDSNYALQCDVKISGDQATLTANGTTICNGIKHDGVKGVLESWKDSSRDAYDDTKDILFGSDDPDQDNIVQISPVDANGKPECTTTADSYFVARIAGEVTELPKEDWKPSDGFTANITWVIKPVPATP